MLAVGAGGGCLDIFSLVYQFSLLSPSLWETARYRLKNCLKGPLNPKQSINQSDFRSLLDFNGENGPHKIISDQSTPINLLKISNFH